MIHAGRQMIDKLDVIHLALFRVFLGTADVRRVCIGELHTVTLLRSIF
jgi:hypothetical protein